MVYVDFIGICLFINVHAPLLEVRYPYFAVKYGYVSPDMLFAAFYHHYVASFGRIVLFAYFSESVQRQDILVCPCWTLFVSVKQNRFLGFLLGVFDVFHHGIGNGEAAVAHGQAG